MRSHKINLVILRRSKSTKNIKLKYTILSMINVKKERERESMTGDSWVQLLFSYVGKHVQVLIRGIKYISSYGSWSKCLINTTANHWLNINSPYCTRQKQWVFLHNHGILLLYIHSGKRYKDYQDPIDKPKLPKMESRFHCAHLENFKKMYCAV